MLSPTRNQTHTVSAVGSWCHDAVISIYYCTQFSSTGWHTVSLDCVAPNWEAATPESDSNTIHTLRPTLRVIWQTCTNGAAVHTNNVFWETEEQIFKSQDHHRHNQMTERQTFCGNIRFKQLTSTHRNRKACTKCHCPPEEKSAYFHFMFPLCWKERCPPSTTTTTTSYPFSFCQQKIKIPFV